MTRPKRTDNLVTGSPEARRRAGSPMISITLPTAVLAALDTIATALGLSRSGAVAALVRGHRRR